MDSIAIFDAEREAIKDVYGEDGKSRIVSFDDFITYVLEAAPECSNQ